MDLTPRTAPGRQVVNGYGDGGFRVAGRRWEGGILIFADRTLPWPVADVTTLTAAGLAEVIVATPKVDLLLLGCGPRMVPVPAEVRDALRAERIVIEALDTGAACRTFNLLMAENRRVAAALVAVG
jgi:uncharacterized protein